MANLMKLCQHYRIQDYRRESNGSKEFLKRWVQSELGAYASLLAEEEVKPMSWNESGFQKWKDGERL